MAEDNDNTYKWYLVVPAQHGRVPVHGDVGSGSPAHVVPEMAVGRAKPFLINAFIILCLDASRLLFYMVHSNFALRI